MAGNLFVGDGDDVQLKGASDLTLIGNLSDSLKSVVTNSTGAAAVNIQDGGNSITVDGAVTVSGTIAATQSGTWNVNNVSGTVSLPTGAATESTLSTLNTKVPAGLTVTSTRLLVDGSGVTQPVSASSLPLPTGASTSTLQTTGNTSLSSIDSKTPALGQALAAASTPVVLTAAQLSTLTPLTSVTVTQATGSNLHAVIDSGSVTANAGTNLNTSALALDTSVNGLLLSQASTTAGQKGPLLLAAVTTAAPSYTTAQSNPLSLTTAGALRVDGSAVTQPVSAASLPLPTGAATESSLAKLTLAQGSTTSGQTGPILQGAVTTNAPTYTTAQTSPLSLTTTGRLRVDLPTTSIAVVSGLTKLAYDDMNVANGGVARATAISTTYTTVYNRSGTGRIFGFSIAFEGNIIGADEFLVKYTVDSVVVFEISTADVGTAAIYNFNTDADGLLLGVQVSNNNFLHRTPGNASLSYASSVKVEIKKASGATKQFHAGLMVLTKE